MQSLRVKKGLLKNVVVVPSSKSYANRALIIASIKKSPVTLANVPTATDVENLISCLSQVGLNISRVGNSLTIQNSFPECERNDVTLETGEGGTTARFLAALLLTGSKTYRLKLGTRLKERPWDDLLKIADELGAEASLKGDILTLKGPVTFPEELDVNCSKTTQFATAFQLIAPEKVEIKPVNLSSSISYWKMTEKIIKDINASTSYAIPGDWSSASYPLAFGAINQKIFFPGLEVDKYQADSKFADILSQFQTLKIVEGGIEVQPGNKTGNIDLDVSDALDLVPALSFFLSHIEGEHVLTGIENLVHKESDRLSEVINLLGVFNREATTDGKSLIIKGSNIIIQQQKNLILPDDHRMVMTGTLFLLHHSGGTISPAEAVKKSYPDFFDLISF